MKNLALAALCFLSTFAYANEPMEEVVVRDVRIKIVLARLSDFNEQDPDTKEWHYVEPKENTEA